MRLLICLLAVFAALDTVGQIMVLRSLASGGDCNFSTYEEDFTLVSDEIGAYNSPGYPRFVGPNILTFGRGGFTYSYMLEEDRWRFQEGDEWLGSINLGEEGYIVMGGSSVGAHPRSQEFGSKTALYRTDEQFNTLYEWPYVPWVDSLFTGTYGGNQNWAHTYIVTDTSILLSYNTLLMECLTEEPYTCRELSNVILQESTWYDDFRSLMSNIVPVYPACDSTYLLRLSVDTISQEMYAYCIDPVSFDIDTFTLQHGCGDFRTNQLQHGRSLAVASLDMRYRRPPACEVYLTLDADGSTGSGSVGDYREEVVCLQNHHALLDLDAELTSNGGRVAYVEVLFDREDCVQLHVDDRGSYRVEHGGDYVRLYLMDKTDYDAAIQALATVSVSWCDDMPYEESIIDITVSLTSGQYVTQQVIYDMTNVISRPATSMDEVTCVEGLVDTLLMVEPPATIVSDDAATMDNYLIYTCIDGLLHYQIINEQGCIYPDSLLVTAYIPAVPNAFSPNGDGSNDTFNPCLTADCVFYIYDRWGGQVHMGHAESPWGGNMRHKPATPGLYTWTVQDLSINTSGTILLMR